MRRTRSLRHHLDFQEQQREAQIPFTPDELKIICQKLSFKPSNDEEIVNMLDPFCADGSALRKVAQTLSEQGATVKTYGIESDQGNRRIAKEKLTKAILGDYHELRTTGTAYSVLFMNPPSGGKNAIGIPREIVAFGDLTNPGKYVYAGTLLVFAVSHDNLASLSSLLPVRFQDVEYSRISQGRILIMAIKSKGRVPKEEAAQEKERLNCYAENIFEIPMLSTEIKHRITPTTNNVIRFRGAQIDPEDISEEINSSSVWEGLITLIAPSNKLIKAPKPLMALDKGRPAIAASAGVLDKGTSSHIRKGFNKEHIEEIVVEDGDTITRTKIKRPVSRLRVFYKGGVKDMEY